MCRSTYEITATNTGWNLDILYSKACVVITYVTMKCNECESQIRGLIDKIGWALTCGSLYWMRQDKITGSDVFQMFAESGNQYTRLMSCLIGFHLALEAAVILRE